MDLGHQAYPGMHIPVILSFYQSEELVSQKVLNLLVGEVSESDPLGPDEYGYYIYDSNDMLYSNMPIYNWIEIDPYLSGLGTILINLNDDGDNQDDVTFIDGWGYGNHIFYDKSKTTLTFPSASLTNVAQVPTLTFGDRTSGGNFKIYNDWYTTHLRQVGVGGLAISSEDTHITINGSNGSGGVQQSIRIKSGIPSQSSNT